MHVIRRIWSARVETREERACSLLSFACQFLLFGGFSTERIALSRSLVPESNQQ
jgi:hypothetical protein